MDLKRESPSASEPEPVPKKRRGTISTDFFSSVKAWILCNYEVHPGSSTSYEGIFKSATEKFSDKISPTIITKAFKEVFGGECYKSRKRIDGIRQSHFINLRSKSTQPSSEIGYLEEWGELNAEALNMTSAGNLNWTTMKDNEHSLSFVHVESISYDGQRAVRELQFLKDDSEKTITISAKYHQRKLSSCQLTNIEAQFGTCGIVSKARNLLNFLGRSSICHGFNAENLKIIDAQISSVKSHMVFEKDVAQERIFSKNCEILANSSGRLCKMCKSARSCLQKKNQRHDNDISSIHQTNHRYMSREELIQKIEFMKGRIVELQYSCNKEQLSE